MQVNNNWSNIKNYFKKLLVSICMFCLVTVCCQTNCYPHIPLKGLFEVLKVDDIGFAHALLHSTWIENMYQYGAGKPHRKVPIKQGKDTSWRAEYKNDAVANLVRKFWFRKTENHQLLSTQFGFLANVGHDQLGTFFGKLINYVYRGCQQEQEIRLIDELFEYAPGAAQYAQELAVLFEKLECEKEQLQDKRFAGLQEATKLFRQKKKELKRKFKNLELYEKAKEVERDAFSKVSKEVLDVRGEYKEIARTVQDLENKINGKIKKKREMVRKALFTPIRQALQLCQAGNIYAPRTTESILWALFFHKLDNLRFFEEKIRAVNNCIKEIDNEFKREDFCGELKQFYKQQDFDTFEKRIKELKDSSGGYYHFTIKSRDRKNKYAQKQIDEICRCHDLSLHYFISCIAGKKFSPVIAQGDCGYEYEPDKMSDTRPDCHETAMLDVLSLLWYNREKNSFDDTLFPDHVIKNGTGFKKLRDALKYFYLADAKGIKVVEYTFEHDDEQFTSLAKLKRLGKISQEEVEQLSISDVPVSYITRPEIKQEFFNIVSDVPGVIYRSEVAKLKKRGNIFEIGSDVRNVLAIFNYFYGTKAKSLEELGDEEKGISIDGREIIFEPLRQAQDDRGEEHVPNKVKIIVDDYNNYFDFKMAIHINSGHTYIMVSGREQVSSEALDSDVPKDILGRILGTLQDQKEISKLQKDENKERLVSIFTLLGSRGLLRNEKNRWDLPCLNLVYYASTMKRTEVKLEMVRDLLERHAQYYGSCQGMVQNLIDALPRNDQHIMLALCKSIITSGLYTKEFLFENIILKERFSDPEFNVNMDVATQVFVLALQHEEFDEIAFEIVKNPTFKPAAWGVNRAFLLALKNKKYKEIALRIVNSSRFKATGRYVREGLKFAIQHEDKSYRDIALSIVLHETFEVNEQGVGAIIELALKKGCKNIALAILSHNLFDGSAWGKEPGYDEVERVHMCMGERYVGVSHVLKLAIQQRDMNIALAIIENSRLQEYGVGQVLLWALKDSCYWVFNIFRDYKMPRTMNICSDFVGNVWQTKEIDRDFKDSTDNISMILLQTALSQGESESVILGIILRVFNFKINTKEMKGIFKKVLARGYQKAALELVHNPSFKLSFYELKKSFLYMFKKGYKNLVLEIVKTFDSYGVAKAFICAFQKGYRVVALEIAKNYKIHKWGKALTGVLEQSRDFSYHLISMRCKLSKENERLNKEIMIELLNNSYCCKKDLYLAEALVIALKCPEYKKLVLKVLLSPEFDCWGDFFRVLRFEKKSKGIFLEIVQSPYFKANCKGIGYILVFALDKGCKTIASIIVDKDEFTACYYEVEDALVVALQKEYLNIALSIVSHRTYNAEYSDRALRVAKKKAKKNQDNQELQKIIDSIEAKQKKE